MNKQKILDKLVEKLKKIFDTRLVSVILHGSCAADLCDNKFSDINLIVVIDKLCAIDLKNANTIIKDFDKTKNPLPLFMDKDEWFNSCDVYPIEYSDIKDRYSIAYGEDIVKPLTVEKSNLRLQCEHETKNLLIKLRQYYLAYNKNQATIKKLLLSVSKSLFALFRAILRLTEEKVSFNKQESIDLISEKVNIDKQVFFMLLEMRKEKKLLDPITKIDYEITIQKLIDSINETLKYIDKL